MKTVGERLVEGLAARGVEVIFGIPGVHTVEMYRGLSGSPVRHVTARHEQGCAFMADGYARVSGKPGVALVITGPGILNTLTAMGQAAADSVPMLVISGVNRRDSLGLGLGLLHELPDQAAMVRPLCPTRQILAASEVGEVLDWAFATMATGRPGPVHIEVPTDVMPLDCDALPAPAALPVAALPDLSAAVAKLNASGSVVILAGGGARGQEAALQALAEKLDAPVVQTVNARGMMYGHPLVVPASPSLDAPRALIAQADQVLAIGTEFGPTDYDMYVRGGFPDLSGMIRVDICARQLARHKAGVTLHGDAGAVMAGLLPLVTPKQADGAARASVARTAARAELGELDVLMPGRLEMVETIRSAMPGALIVGDSTQAIYAANLYYDHDRAGGWFNAATGFGALGYGPGAAVGAALAAPGAEVVCLIGDGGLQFSPGELRTAVDERLAVTFIVWNNAAFGEIADAMRGANTEVIGCSPSPLNMEPFAAACDLPFASVPLDPEALHAALMQPHSGPRMIEVRVAR
ncbi:MAG: 5-guanidino-2-oxopentanoate decarboxylase [Cypionkella sp.]|uniref:5-guanidino-2-oxopentanoate decarboxylase n=1 Tax=Cypionkella sp. TaxID=2811411 RepID=UPI002ABAD5D1|nr:5-guanidino-2-oxopentanoate decarboxylase [Cypionkella sp.]MDZ4309542.1 5-guanidino-2-oxopentanoate decarboxylase [Cypionkella sp.]